MLERLQDNRARALASDEALAVEVERTGGAQGVLLTRKSAEVREARDAFRVELRRKIRDERKFDSDRKSVV